jgi:hypothetical protein
MTQQGTRPAKTFAIIGAGAAGLCAAKNLLRSGIDVTVFEIGSKVGGLWAYDNDSGRSPAYRSLHINSEAKVSAFEDFPFPADGPLYPNTAQMEAYFNAYADHFGVMDHIRFRQEVTAIAQEGARVRVTLKSGESALFDGVVIGAGHQSIPRHPPEIKGYKGDYIHSHAYRVPEPYAGKRVLVVGLGNSGVDIAADLCTVTDMTFIAVRSPVLVMPRMMFGVPQSRILKMVERPFLPWRVRVWTRIMLTRIFHGRMEQWGLTTPKTRTHPISHPTLMAQMAWGNIKIKPGIDHAEGRDVHFTDGTTETIDAIVGATGYLTDLPFLPADKNPLAGTWMNLYNRIVHPDLPNTYFIGYFDAAGGSNIRMMDDQARYIAAVASGALQLPAPADMEKAIERDRAWQKQQFPDRPRYGLELDPIRYRKALARDYRRRKAR